MEQRDDPFCSITGTAEHGTGTTHFVPLHAGEKNTETEGQSILFHYVSEGKMKAENREGFLLYKVGDKVITKSECPKCGHNVWTIYLIGGWGVASLTCNRCASRQMCHYDDVVKIIPGNERRGASLE